MEWDLTVFSSLFHFSCSCFLLYILCFLHPLFCLVFFWNVGYRFWIVHLARGIYGKVQVGLMDAAAGEIKDRNSMEAMCLVLSGIWVSYPSGKSRVKVIMGLSCGIKYRRWLFIEIVSELVIIGWHELRIFKLLSDGTRRVKDTFAGTDALQIGLSQNGTKKYDTSNDICKT